LENVSLIYYRLLQFVAFLIWSFLELFVSHKKAHKFGLELFGAFCQSQKSSQIWLGAFWSFLPVTKKLTFGFVTNYTA